MCPLCNVKKTYKTTLTQDERRKKTSVILGGIVILARLNRKLFKQLHKKNKIEVEKLRQGPSSGDVERKMEKDGAKE